MGNKRKTMPTRPLPGYLKKGDKRAAFYKWAIPRAGAWHDHLGGPDNISIVQDSLIERLVHVEAMARQMEEEVRAGKSVDTMKYLSLVDRIHTIGRTVGLRRVAKSVDLHTYMAAGKAVKP